MLRILKSLQLSVWGAERKRRIVSLETSPPVTRTDMVVTATISSCLQWQFSWFSSLNTSSPYFSLFLQLWGFVFCEVPWHTESPNNSLARTHRQPAGRRGGYCDGTGTSMQGLRPLHQWNFHIGTQALEHNHLSNLNSIRFRKYRLGLP